MMRPSGSYSYRLSIVSPFSRPPSSGGFREPDSVSVQGTHPLWSGSVIVLFSELLDWLRTLSERWFLSVGNALAITAAPGANHLAVAVGDYAFKGPSDLTDLARVEDQEFLAQTPVAIEPAKVVSQEFLDAISLVHSAKYIGTNRPGILVARMR